MTEIAEIDKIVAVSNTGPLISAFESGRTDLLKRYFSLIYISSSELAEFANHGWTAEINQLIAEGFVVVIELNVTEQQQAEAVAQQIAKLPTSGNPDWRHHLPEAEAIALTQERTELGVGIILLDEKAARQIARELGLRLTGFPGVVGWCGRDGFLTKSDIRQVLKTCQQQGTYYSDRLIETLAENYGR
ncbi:MAG: hypothetical protein GDA56_30420 [Hormoscilla sp. GM7CHS1pb]|nr:hypothetical protein [Hormoscilla sp. GM7CHS1pb]